jgi:serine/threonine protein kinase
VKLFEIFEDEGNIYLILEFMTGGKLFDRIVEKEHYSEKEAADTIRPIVDGIKYCHALGIVHRDLKVSHAYYFIARKFIIRHKGPPLANQDLRFWTGKSYESGFDDNYLWNTRICCTRNTKGRWLWKSSRFLEHWSSSLRLVFSSIY